jgi:transcriptional regulator with XRE-family HTH domain
MRTKNFKDALEQRLDRNEIKSLQSQAKLEEEAHRLLCEGIATAIKKHMIETGMGFNEITRRLGISPSQTAKIARGDANLTVASIAHIAAFLGKKPHLTFR